MNSKSKENAEAAGSFEWLSIPTAAAVELGRARESARRAWAHAPGYAVDLLRQRNPKQEKMERGAESIKVFHQNIANIRSILGFA